MDFSTYLRELSEPDAPATGPENRVIVARTDSTNRLARRIASELLGDGITPPGAVVIALEQAAGRGRHGRRWESPPGGGVYASRLLPVADIDALQTIPLLAAVGLAEVIDSLIPDARCRLKWPNDLMVHGKKMGGVLVESVTLAGGQGALAIIGFGINYREVGPAGTLMAMGATSLLAEIGGSTEPPSLGRLALRLLDGLESALAHLGETAHAVRRFSDLTLHRSGDPIRCRTGDETVEGVLVGFEEQGFLRVRGDDGVERSISSGEIVEEVEA